MVQGRSFFAELKRRNVLRAAVLYVGAVWALAQGIAQLSGPFGLSDAVTRWFMAACAIGFPFWIAFAWFYEFTPHGFKRESEVTVDAPQRHTNARKLDFAIIGVLMVAVVLLASGYFIRRNAPPGAATRSAPAKSIAVLPFENLSSDKNNAYFADGMQDMILTKLASIGNIKVIARTSTESYGSHPADLKTIAEQLGVATLLEGSVQKSGNQVLINVQLIDASTDNHLWAEAYQRNLHNIFDVEGEVAQQVAFALNAKLTQTETVHLSTAPTQNPQAYDSFLRAEYDANQAFSSFKTSDFESAVRDYSAATQQDPKFLLAWSRLAQIQSLMAWAASPVSGVNRKQLAAQAKESAERTEDLAPQSAEAQMAQGWYRLYVLTDLGDALSAFQAAVKLEPQNAEALYGVGTTYYHLGQFDASAGAYQKAAVFDPRNLNILDQLANVYLELRRYGEARQVYKLILAIAPASGTPTRQLVHMYVLAGDLDGARAILDAAPASVQAEFRYSITQAELMLYGRDYDGALRVLLTAVAKEHSDYDHGVVEESFGDVEWAAGNHQQARAHYQRATSLLEAALNQSPERARGDLSWVYARLGRNEEALAQAQLFLKDRQAAKSVQRENFALVNLAAVQAQIGQTDQAIAGLERLLAMPAGEFVSVPLLKLDPIWDSIRHDPRFQALLKKYASHKPAVAPATTVSASTTTAIASGRIP